MLVSFAAACGGEDEPEEATQPAQPQGRVILRDDFSDKDSGWYTGNTATSQESYTNGRYRVLIKTEEGGVSDALPIDRAVDAMSVEVDVVVRNGTSKDEVGLICYSDVEGEEDTGYYIGISPGEGWIGIFRVVNGEGTSLKQETEQDEIQGRAATNRLRAECVGKRGQRVAKVTAYVNGKRIASAEDSKGFPRFDGIGVSTFSVEGRTVATYDDVVVRELR